MRIVFATDSYWPRASGRAVSIDTFAQELAAQGHDVHVLAPELPGHAAGSSPRGLATVHRFCARGLPFFPEARVLKRGERAAAFRLLDALAPGVVHTHTEAPLSRAAWQWARARAVPLVMTAHTLWPEVLSDALPLPRALSRALGRWFLGRVYAQADVVVAPSQAMRSALLGAGVARPVEVIPTGFQSSAFAHADRSEAKCASPLYRAHPGLEGRTVLLSVGRVVQQKNLGLVLDAVERLWPRWPQLAWLVVGDGPELPALRREVGRRGLSDAVFSTGALDRERVQHAYALADVLCVASSGEAQRVAAVEALGTGLPVVAVDSAPSQEVLAQSAGGLLCASNAAAFAQTVEHLLTDPFLYRTKAREARGQAHRFDASAMAKRLEDVYAQLLAQHRADSPLRLHSATARPPARPAMSDPTRNAG